MPIRPIDIVKSHEASQYKQLQNQRMQQEQVQISKSFQNMIRSEASKPVETSKSDNKEFRYDAKEESRNSYKHSGSKKKKNQDKKKDKGSDTNRGRPGGIDILI